LARTIQHSNPKNVELHDFVTTKVRLVGGVHDYFLYGFFFFIIFLSYLITIHVNIINKEIIIKYVN